MVDSLFLRARTSEGNKLWTKCKETAPVNIFKLLYADRRRGNRQPHASVKATGRDKRKKDMHH